jgi:signal transduction histidine kinase
MPNTHEIVDAALVWLAGVTKGSLIVIDAAEVVVFANAGAYDLMGVDPAEHSVVGSHIEKVFSYTGYTRAQSPILRSLHEGVPFSQVRTVTPKGVFIVDTSPVVIAGKVAGAVALGYDISREERIQQALYEITAHLTQSKAEASQHRDALAWLIEHSPIGIMAVDATGYVTSVNNTWLELVQADKDAVLGKHYLQLSPSVGAALIAGALQGTNVSGTRAHIRDRVYDISTYSRQSNVLNQAAGALVLAVDCTEKARKEADLARLERLNLVGEMAASIAHEIRNPLTTVRGFLQLFAEKPEFAPYRKFTHLMTEEIDRACSIISTYLSLSRTAVSIKPCCLSVLIECFAPVLNSLALVKGMRMSYALRSPATIIANEAEIRQLLTNLVNNALEAMTSGGTVSITTTELTGSICLAVSDEGSGIAASLIPQLGTPFLTTKENGTGLGLAVCYRIAERHGAKIHVESSPAGSTFTVAFPKATCLPASN